jgi:hypothetical protein
MTQFQQGDCFRSESGEIVRIVKANSSRIEFKYIDTPGAQHIVTPETFITNFPIKVEVKK